MEGHRRKDKDWKSTVIVFLALLTFFSWEKISLKLSQLLTSRVNFVKKEKIPSFEVNVNLAKIENLLNRLRRISSVYKSYSPPVLENVLILFQEVKKPTKVIPVVTVPKQRIKASVKISVSAIFYLKDDPSKSAAFIDNRILRVGDVFKKEVDKGMVSFKVKEILPDKVAVELETPFGEGELWLKLGENKLEFYLY